MNRKQRRTLNKLTNKQVTSTIDLMTNIPEECSVCKKYYDKRSREMATTWFVDVFNSSKTVILTCPECRKGDLNG